MKFFQSWSHRGYSGFISLGFSHTAFFFLRRISPPAVYVCGYGMATSTTVSNVYKSARERLHLCLNFLPDSKYSLPSDQFRLYAHSKQILWSKLTHWLSLGFCTTPGDQGGFSLSAVTWFSTIVRGKGMDPIGTTNACPSSRVPHGRSTAICLEKTPHRQTIFKTEMNFDRVNALVFEGGHLYWKCPWTAPIPAQVYLSTE